MGGRLAWMLVMFLAAATSAGALTEHTTSRVSTAIWAVDNPAALAEAMDVATNFTARPEHFAAADKDPNKEFPTDPSKAHMVNEGNEGGRKLSQSTTAANDVWQKIRDLVQDVCVQQSGKVCDEIELTGSSDWWKYYFPHKPLIDVTAGATQVAITTSAKVAASQLSRSEHYCAYDERSSTVCTLAGKTDSSSSVTQSSTSTFTFSGKVGYVIKVKTSASDTTWEHTLDFGYSLSESKATTRLVGQATTGSVIVPMKPEDKSCVVIEVVMERAKMGGIFNVFAEATGWIGVRQRDKRNWKIDATRNLRHEYRAMSFAGLVAVAKQGNIQRAKDWTIASNGNAQLRTQINLDLDLATRSYANPQKYPNTDSRCARASRRLADVLPAVTAPESSATLAHAPGLLPQQTPGSRGRQLMAGAPTPQKTMRQNMEAMVQAWCKYQSGKQCDVLDFDGTTEWWRTFFITSQPTTISTGLDRAQLVQGSQTVAPRTVAAMLCPYRPFPYSCKLDEQSISSITQTTTAGSSWNFGQTAKLTALYGFDFLGNGVMAGLTVSMSTSFSFSDSTAEAKTESSASIQSYQVNMDPSQGRQCLYMSNKLQVLNMKATQVAWMKVDGRVGTHQKSRTRWRTDVTGSDGHFYRSTPFSLMVSTAISLNWPEARYWTIKNGDVRVEVPIELQVDLGTNGTASSTYYPDGTPQCTQSSQSAPLPSPAPSPSPILYTGNLVDYFVPVASPGMKVCGTSNAANLLVLSRIGSLMNGASVSFGNTIPVEAYRSTATSASASTADWILAGVSTPYIKMVQLRVTSSASTERCVYITAVAAGYVTFPAGKALDQTSVNEAWRNRLTANVATCVECNGYGVSALAIPSSNCASPPGFVFYPGMDSDGGDMGNFLAGGNDDDTSLAELCKTKPTCRGFNSNGWLKSVVRPRAQWIAHAAFRSDPCKGLSVRI